MKLYRLQTVDGKGPFRGTTNHLSRYFELKYDGSHPTPSIDGLYKFCIHGDEPSFACPSMESLTLWFDPFRDSDNSHEQWMREEDYNDLHQNGFKVYVLEVPEPHYKIGLRGQQVAFRKNQASIVEILPLSKLFNTLACV